MTTEEPTDVPDPKEDLIGSVRTLNRNVGILIKALKEDYPKRSELERDYPNRKEVRRKRLAAFAFAVVILLVSQFLTVSMVSYCFLNDIGDAVKPGCQIIPGYSRALDLNEDRLARFEEVAGFIESNQEQIEENQADIKKLQEQILELQKPNTSSSSE